MIIRVSNACFLCGEDLMLGYMGRKVCQNDQNDPSRVINPFNQKCCKNRADITKIIFAKSDTGY